MVAVNPHEQLNIYTLDFVRSYNKHRLGELPAHIFAVAENALADVCKNQYGNSAVVISGESGSGKTESSKLILHYLAAVCGQHSFVEQQLLEANPIIEGRKLYIIRAIFYKKLFQHLEMLAQCITTIRRALASTQKCFWIRMVA